MAIARSGPSKSDVRRWNGTAPNNLQAGRVDAYLDQSQADKAWATAARTLTAFELSVIRSIAYYSGTHSLAAGSSGVDKDVTISSVTTSKAILLPAAVSSSGQASSFGSCGASSNYQRVSIPASTTVRFHGTSNASGSAETLSYAFWVVEFK
jgi:hypothetical protein